MNIKTLALLGASIVAVLSAPASAASLTNTNGGDGYLDTNAAPFYYTVFGSNNGSQNNYTLYSEVAPIDFTGSFGWRYHTDDVGGAAFDSAGYFINNAFFQLSPNSSVPGFTSTGIVSIALNAGDTFGAYVLSTDGIFGRGSISFGDVSAVGNVPEPATWAMMIGGIGAVGGAMRRKARTTTTVRFA